MDKTRNILNSVIEKIIVVIFAFMTFLVTWQVITRFIFNSPSTITEALAKYMFLWLVMITSAYVFGKRDHMSLTFFVTRFQKAAQIKMAILAEAVIFLFVIIVLGYGGGYIALNAMSQMDSALPVPIGVVYLALPVGGILSAFYSVCNIMDLRSELLKGGAQ